MTITLLALIASVPPNEIPLATGRAFSSLILYRWPSNSYVNRRHQVSYLFRTTGEVLGVSLSAALTQTLLVRELRMRIVSDGADEVCRLMFFFFSMRGTVSF
jgi:hypothetical protein